MADRIGILRDGRLVEEGTPEEIYNHPRSLFAATFLGDANIFSGTWTGDAVTLKDGTLIKTAHGASMRAGEKVQCAVRPERMQILGAGAAASDNAIQGRVIRRLFAGVSSTLFVEALGSETRVVVPNSGAGTLRDGENVTLTWSKESTIPVA
jgi:putative spermidine/putrescine transport system ATP-binding protein/spermidine/putrescine transport system ATP-binding protein